MNWQRISSIFKKIFHDQLGESSKAVDDRPDMINKYTFNCKIDDPEHFPDRDIRKLILLNPWAAVSTPPMIKYVKDKDGATQIEIGFNVISMKEGKMIEQKILDFLQKSTK
jgi:hypothetical protein